MKKTAILACQTLHDEVELTIQQLNCPYPIFWVQENLHDVPRLLRDNIQKELDRLEGYEQVLLCFGTCGNAVVGLHTGSFELIVPRVDDCLSLLMGSMEHRYAVLEGRAGIFLTAGWLRHERGLEAEIRRVYSKYDPQKAERLFHLIYGAFDSLNVIDTGAYRVETILERVRAISRTLHLTCQVRDGTTCYLKKLFSGPWTERQFIRIPPYSQLTAEQAELDVSNRI